MAIPRVMLADPFGQSAFLLQAMLKPLGLPAVRVGVRPEDGGWYAGDQPPVRDEAAEQSDIAEDPARSRLESLIVGAAWLGILDLQTPTPVHGLLVRRILAERRDLPWVALLPERGDRSWRAELPDSVWIVSAIRPAIQASALESAIDRAIAARAATGPLYALRPAA